MVSWKIPIEKWMITRGSPFWETSILGCIGTGTDLSFKAGEKKQYLHSWLSPGFLAHPKSRVSVTWWTYVYWLSHFAQKKVHWITIDSSKLEKLARLNEVVTIVEPSWNYSSRRLELPYNGWFVVFFRDPNGGQTLQLGLLVAAGTPWEMAMSSFS